MDKSSYDMFTYIYNGKLKDIKKKLGSKCTHLANRKTILGERFIDVTLVVEGENKKFSFSLPTKLQDINNSDYEYLEELIMSKFKNYVSGGSKINL